MSGSNSNSAAPARNGAALVGTLAAHAQSLPVNLGRWIAALVRPPRAPLPRVGPRSGVAVIVIVGVIILLMFFVDTRAIEGARHLPRWFRPIAEEITDFGRSSVFLFPFGFILLLIAAVTTPALPRMAQGVFAALAVRFGFLFVAIGLPSLFATIVKRLIGRARPYVGAHDDPFAFVPFIWRPEYASMPSGHSTTAAAAAVAIGAVWPSLRPVAWLYAFIIMMTRIVLIAHHPSDVLGGALVGAVGALAVQRWFAARRLGFSPRDLRAYPWPSWRRVKAAARAVVR